MGQKVKFVLSDLHLGAGYIGGADNHLEDFTADEQLADLLHKICHESDRKQHEVELIINGDFFDLLQVPAVDNYDPEETYPKETYLDSSEKASIKSLQNIIAGHKKLFYALSDYMHTENPKRRITIIKGNHDVHFFWPGVKSCLRETLGASGTRASLLLFAAEFVSREKIYIEHGHQHTEPIDRYPDSYDPRLQTDPSQLYYPPSSRFVIEFLNNAKKSYRFVNGVKPVTTLLWYAVHWDFHFGAQLLSTLINLMETDHSEIEHCLRELNNYKARYQMMHSYNDDIKFREQFNQQFIKYLGITDLDVANDDTLSIGYEVQTKHRNILRTAAKKIAEREGAKVVLFGHTHYPVQEILSAGAIYINTGCWLPTYNFPNTQTDMWDALFNNSYQYDADYIRLPYARIDYDEQNNPSAQLLYFNGS